MSAIRTETLAEGVTLLGGDCLDGMKTLASESVDAGVSDPPYGLGREPTASETLAMLKAWIEGGHYDVRSKSGFMGKEWDAFVPQPAVWREFYRVLKPGAFVVCFFGTRTYDLGVLAMRLAGVEVRDMVSWMYGSSFPKSQNVSAFIDKHLGFERNVVGRNPNWRDPSKNADHHERWNNAVIPGDVTEPASPQAQEFDGFGTALKPAFEPIVLARKPLSEPTVAANVLRWRTGALNIDACRVEHVTVGTGNLAHNPHLRAHHKSHAHFMAEEGGERADYVPAAQGRWPTNVVHDGSDEVVGAFPYTKSAAMKREVDGYEGDSVTGFIRGRSGPSNQRADEGSAARFFYSAKASRAERVVKCVACGARTLGHPTCGCKGADDKPARTTSHPTVKPVDLKRWLVRLVTPPGGTVIDPFAGTGTTGAAALAEGFKAVLCEREPEYQDDIRRRISEFMARSEQAEAEESKQADFFIEKPKPLKQEAFEL